VQRECSLLLTRLQRLLAPSLSTVGVQDDSAFLPPSAPSVVAQQQLNRWFPEVPGSGGLVVVVSSRHPFDLADLAFIGTIDTALRRGRLASAVTSVDSPLTTPALDGALVAPGRRTALVVAVTRLVPFTPAGDRLASTLQRLANRRAPTGVQVAVTGNLGLGADEAQALVTSFDRAALVAALLVLTVMVLVYRSPIALVVPLASAAVAVGAAQGLVGLVAAVGLAVSSMAGTFLLVIVFGAGTDYCLFLVARQRRELAGGCSVSDAVAASVASAGRVVVLSGVIVTLSFLALGTARFGLYRTMGPALAVAVLVTVAVAITFAPAAMAILGHRLAVWGDRRRPPRDATADPALVAKAQHPTGGATGGWWRRLAWHVERRPLGVAAVGVVVLLGASSGVVGLHQSFDLLDELPAQAPARVGFAAAARSFGSGAAAPLDMVVRSPEPLTSGRGRRAVEQVVAAVRALPAVASVASPLALGSGGPVVAAGGGGRQPFRRGEEASAGPDAGTVIDPLLANGGRLALLQVAWRGDPFGEQAQADVAVVRAAGDRALQAAGLSGGQVLAAGPTAQFADIAQLARGDLVRIVAAVLVVLALVVGAAFDSLLAPVLLTGSLVLSYMAALGMTTVVFERIAGRPDLSFWVPPFLFVVLVALGADYTMLVTSAVRERVRAGTPTRAAAGAGLLDTAPVVSAAGMVLAGSFLALLAAPLPTLQEIGFAVGVGVLVDTFVVRPLVVPALLALVGDAVWWRPGRRGSVLRRAVRSAGERPREGTSTGRRAGASTRDWRRLHRPRSAGGAPAGRPGDDGQGSDCVSCPGVPGSSGA